MRETSALLCRSTNGIRPYETWTFVGKKQARLKGRERMDPTVGDIYLFTALDMQSKLIVTHLVGKRNFKSARLFTADLERKMVRAPNTQGDDRPQISSDGYGPYPAVIDEAFGQSVRHAIIIKNYWNPQTERGCNPPKMSKANRYSVEGIRNLATICTSHVERCNEV